MPRGDIEVDVDMENVEEGVYLWGALLSDRANGETTSDYRAFATWDFLTVEEQTRNFVGVWNWRRDLSCTHAAHM